MFDHLLAPLRDTLRPHFKLRKTRLEAMACNHVRSGELPDCVSHTSVSISILRSPTLSAQVEPTAGQKNSGGGAATTRSPLQNFYASGLEHLNVVPVSGKQDIDHLPLSVGYLQEVGST